MDWFGPTQNAADQHGPIRINTDRHRPIRIDADQYRLIRTDADPCGDPARDGFLFLQGTLFERPPNRTKQTKVPPNEPNRTKCHEKK